MKGAQPEEVPLREHYKCKKCTGIQRKNKPFNGQEIQEKSLSKRQSSEDTNLHMTEGYAKVTHMLL